MNGVPDNIVPWRRTVDRQCDIDHQFGVPLMAQLRVMKKILLAASTFPSGAMIRKSTFKPN